MLQVVVGRATVNETVDEDPEPIRLASAPCMLGELRADGTPGVDAEQARDVARWRKVERERLLGLRARLTAEYRADQALSIGQQVEKLIASSGVAEPVVSFYWPIKGEPDLRGLMLALSGAGVSVALPVAVAMGQPLTFHEWRPDCRMARGLWRIPYPAEGRVVVPDIVIAPVVGFDLEGYRLGYGGGFFDRTLAQLNPKPLALGVGYPEAGLRTIFPQPYDIPMDWVITGAGILKPQIPVR